MKPATRNRVRVLASRVTAPSPVAKSVVCSQASCESLELRSWARRLGLMPGKLHRKVWEFCFTASTLDKLSALRTGKRGLGFGCGNEPLPAMFHGLGVEIIATDQLPQQAEQQGFRLPVNIDREVDMRSIPEDLRDFDFVWSCCALEHLGSIAAGLEFVCAAMRCLKPGGVAVHTTEFNITPDNRTLDNTTTVLFRRQDIDALVARLRREGHEIDVDYSLGDGPADKYVDAPPYCNGSNPHLRLQLGNYVTTSIALVIRKSQRQSSAAAGHVLDLQARLTRFERHPDHGRTLTWYGRLDDFTGYGQFSASILKHLARRQTPSVECIWTAGSEFRHSRCPPEVITMRRMGLPPNDIGHILFVHPQVTSAVSMPNGTDVSWMTMWESTRIPPTWRDLLNRCRRVIVPSAWNASCFSACGVNVPIEIVQLGVEPDDWPCTPLMPRDEGPLVFGTAGSFDQDDGRKRLLLVAEAFRRAFPYETGVRLEIKTQGGLPDAAALDDPRVLVRNVWLSPMQMRQWYQRIHVFATASAGEGWGLHLQQAMSVGRPVIGPLWGGVTEFFSADNGYAVEYRLVPGRGHWLGCGLVADVSLDDMVRKMREVYHDRATLEAKAVLAHPAAAAWPIARTAKRLLEVMQYD